MPPLARLVRVAVWLLTLLTLAGRGAEPAAAPPPLQFEIFAPQSALATFAHDHGFVLAGFDPTATGPARTGDRVTMLVTLRAERKPARQWIVDFTIATPTEKERAPDPKRTLTVNLTNGREYHFAAGENVALAIRSAGPFGEGLPAPADVKPARAVISPDLLAVGLDETSRTMLRMMAEQSRAAKAGVKQQAATLTEPEERAIVGFVPALATLFQGIEDTPGLREILWEVAEKPPVWSIAKHLGRIDLNLKFDNDSVEAFATRPEWAPEDGALYRFSPLLILNETPALRCSLYVMAPQPPLLTTAGVIAIAAEAPAGKARRVDIQILSARRGPGK